MTAKAPVPGALSVQGLCPAPRSAGAWLAGVLFAPRCVFCGVRRERRPVCSGCAGLVQALRTDQPRLQARLACIWMPRVFAVWQYRGPVRRAVLAFKYHGSSWRGEELGRQLLAAVREADLPVPDLIVPVPDSARDDPDRDYSVPDVLAQRLSDAFGAPKEDTVLHKRFDIPQQHRLAGLRRTGNPVGAYRVTHPEKLRGRTVWLVDDIITTGATLRECSRMLWLYGAQQVVGICLCATPQAAPKGHDQNTAAADAAAPGKE